MDAQLEVFKEWLYSTMTVEDMRLLRDAASKQLDKIGEYYKQNPTAPKSTLEEVLEVLYIDLGDLIIDDCDNDNSGRSATDRRTWSRF